MAAAVVALGAACGGSDDPDRRGPGPRTSDGRLVRAWIAALNRDDFRGAAAYFARGAIVQQSREFRLRDRAEAEAFNRSLPCKSTVTDVKDEGATTVAAFALRPRPGIPRAACDSVVRVRFRSRAGKFVEWRQLPERAPPSGRPA